jgi:hypothetical protein
MKRTQRQVQRRFRNTYDYLYANYPRNEITKFLIEITRAQRGPWITLTPDMDIEDLLDNPKALFTKSQDE